MSHNSLTVSHNMEVAHRLSQLPGKCQNIHGHSMQVTMTVSGLPLNENGIAGGIDFGSLKKAFREYLDNHFDHRLLLNAEDELAGEIITVGDRRDGQFTVDADGIPSLPGLHATPGDPTVENIAMWICKFMTDQVIPGLITYDSDGDLETVTVDIQETNTNGSSWTEVIE